MTAEQFAYWLNGFVELGGGMPSDAQWKSIKEHLAQVFNKVTPPIVKEKVLPTTPFDKIVKDWEERIRREGGQTGPFLPWYPPVIQPQQWPAYPTIIC